MALTKITSNLISSNAISAANITDASITAADLHATLDLTGKTVTVATASAGDNDTSVASTAFVTTAINNIVDGAPANLNTLNEIAASMNDDATLNTTLVNLIAAKLPLAGGTMTGALIVTDGSASAPSIGNSGDTNTGIYFPADDQLGLVVGGSRKLLASSAGITVNNGDLIVDTDKLVVDISAGHVGIGDSSPQDYLEINGSGSGLGGLTISNSTHNHAALSFARSSTATARIYISEPDATHTSQMYFQTSDASGSSPNLVNAMTIDEDQNVGIGTSAPSTDLHIGDGTGSPFITIDKSTTGTSGILLKNAGSNKVKLLSNASEEFELYVNNALAMYVKENGNVGIGTTSPSSKLVVAASNAGKGIELQVSTGSVQYLMAYDRSASDYIDMQIDAENLKFGTGNGTPRMYIDNAGLVGIGTTGPGVNLDVNSTAQNVFRLDTTNSDGPLQIFRNNGVVRGYIGNAEGILGQGTTNFGIRAQASLYFGTGGGNTRMIIDSSGRVGIGQASPTAAVHITGSGDTKIIIEDGSAEQSITAHSGGLNYDVVSGDAHTFLVAGTDAVFIDSGSARIKQTAITSSSSAVAWDAKAAANAYHITTENTTFSAPSNAVEGAVISVELAQGGTARTIAWNTVFEFAASTAPTVTATANKTDIFTFRYNGSVWQEIGRVQNMAQT